MIYLDISAAVHSRAGLGRYAEKLAHALLMSNPEAYGLFYNLGKDGRFPPSLIPFNRPQHLEKIVPQMEGLMCIGKVVGLTKILIATRA